MKKSFVIVLVIILIVIQNFSYPPNKIILQYSKLDGNNISSFFYNSGIFNHDFRTSPKAGFEWPKGTWKTAFFSAGLSIGAYITGSNGIPKLAETMASYNGEWGPGYILNGVPQNPSYMHIYTVRRGDNAINNQDYANWYLMVPFGAPYIDVNNNGVYDNGIDTPGVKNSSETIFQCLTDGFTGTHYSGEGFGGGIIDPLLKSELHLTAWCYSQPSYTDMQFLKFELINKNDSAWRSTYMGIVGDPDLGNGNDDYIGCDTSRKLGYCYNGDNNDEGNTGIEYGINPPAVGVILLKGAVNHSVIPNLNLNMTSFTFFSSPAGSPPCESDPNGETLPAYYMLKGLKKDQSPFMNPLVSPPVPTKFTYTGDPETQQGWTESKGSVQNCGGTIGNIISVNPKGDRRFIISMGADNFTVAPNDTQRIVMCQLIARGANYLNSVTKLKLLSDIARNFYNTGYTISVNNISAVIPDKYYLYQNYPNPFNPNTKIKFSIMENGKIENGIVTLKVYDIMGKEVTTLVNEKLKSGTFEVTFDGTKYPSGIYFYRLKAGDFSETKRMILLK